MSSSSSTGRASIDRFEGAVAVLIVDEVERRIPRARLPADAKEGDVIDLHTMRVDVQATEELRAAVSAARARAKKHRAPPGDL